MKWFETRITGAARVHVTRCSCSCPLQEAAWDAFLLWHSQAALELRKSRWVDT
jgi:hypothetical protein